MTIMLPGSRMCAVHEYCSWSTTLMYQSARIPTHTSTLVYFIYLHLFESILISLLCCILILYKSYIVLSLYVPTSPSALVAVPDACKHVDAQPSSFSQLILVTCHTVTLQWSHQSDRMIFTTDSSGKPLCMIGISGIGSLFTDHVPSWRLSDDQSVEPKYLLSLSSNHQKWSYHWYRSGQGFRILEL